MRNTIDIIKALGIHTDNSSIAVLEKIGTNNPNDKIREATSTVLINKNINESLNIVLLKDGKGIHDLSPKVVDSTIKNLNKLKDKTKVNKILDDAITSHNSEKIKERILIVKQMLHI